MKKSLLFIFVLFTITLQSQTKIESAIDESYNGASWDNTQGYNYTYDMNNNLKTEINYNWDGSGWIESYKIIYNYNGNNKAIDITEQYLDGNNQFVNGYKTDYMYNTGGYVNLITDKDWDGTQWIDQYQTVITYNNTQIASAISSIWNGTQWILETRSTMSYTGNKITQILNDDRSGTLWVPSDRDIFTYNASNQKVSYISEVWDGTTYVEEDRTNYVLDSSGNRTRETYIFDGSNQDKTEYNYNFSAQLSNFAHPFKDKTGVDYFFEDFPYVNKVLGSSYYNYNSSTSNYDISSRTTYDYNAPLTLNVEEVKPTQRIKLHPNPSNSFIQIAGLTTSEKIAVYNILGTKVFEKVINVNDEINIQSLANGLYLLKFENGTTLKFLKE